MNSKRFLNLLCLTAMSFTLCSCGGDDPDYGTHPRASAGDLAIVAATAPLGIVGGVAAALIISAKDKDEQPSNSTQYKTGSTSTTANGKKQPAAKTSTDSNGTQYLAR
jgi:hypothetical protein